MTSGSLETYLTQLRDALKKCGALDTRIVEEVRAHLVDAVEGGLQRGLPVDVAEREAIARFGDAEMIAAHFVSSQDRALFRMGYRGWSLLAVAVAAGVVIFSVGFRLTDEVTVIVGLLGLSAAALGFSAPRQWWLMALGLGLGVGLHNLDPAPPYRPDARHLALYGPPQPLPLPFGLTGNHVVTIIAVALILMSFLFVAAGMGSITRRLGARPVSGRDSVG